ncbi:hypothetical protein BU15DRAFT_85203 [Melanogaster broomeanus]|nr:hypothetical protein BU15DRAFT_85203 [Melanogaster broomeanus]
MVVTHIDAAAASTTRKKARRSFTKKKATKGNSETAPIKPLDVDEDMEPVPLVDESLESNLDTKEDDELMIDIDPNHVPQPPSLPSFPVLPASAIQSTSLKSETRRIPIPPHRMTPIKKDWINIFSPLTEILGLQVRMNVQRRCVEIRTSKHTKEIGAVQKGVDFVKAYSLGFDVNDAIALLRLDDLYLDSFEIKDVKTLHGDHLSRAIGRIAGQDGKTKFTIENASRTRIVLADTKIHIMGSFQNIKIARDAIVSLILGSPPGKVYAGLRTVSSRMKQRAL